MSAENALTSGATHVDGMFKPFLVKACLVLKKNNLVNRKCLNTLELLNYTT